MREDVTVVDVVYLSVNVSRSDETVFTSIVAWLVGTTFVLFGMQVIYFCIEYVYLRVLTASKISEFVVIDFC